MIMLTKMSVFQLYLISIFIILSLSAKVGNSKLLLVQSIFRHGDRAPLKGYPNDPNGDEKWPNGRGHLTQLGKSEHYQLGKILREMYDGFITSDPNEIIVNSSEVDRCLYSAASHLASLYAPTKEFQIAEGLNWQPIPIHYLPKEEDIYLCVVAPCDRFDVEYSKSMNSEKIREFYQQNQAAVKDITKYSGVNFSIPSEAFDLFDILNAEAIHNLTIPEWANRYRKEIRAIGELGIQAFAGSTIQIRLRIGPFLGLLTENIMKKIRGTTPNLKFIVNSSHDLLVMGILRALNFDFPPPPYAATLLFELHEMPDTTKAVRVLYANSSDPSVRIDRPKVLVLDNCTEFCPVEKFIKTYEGLIPQNLKEECQVDPGSKVNAAISGV